MEHVSKMKIRCPDCEAAPGDLHVAGCDHEPCPRCGRQLFTCICIYEVNGLDPDRLELDRPEIYQDGPTPAMEAVWDATWGPRRIRWPGEPHGAAECRAYGLWALPTPAGPVPMPAGTPGVEEDFGALLTTCRWDVEAQRFIRVASPTHLPLPPASSDQRDSITPAELERIRSRVRSTPGLVCHIVDQGEEASDEAMVQGRVEVVLADPETGKPESYGRLLRRRRCGKYQLRLARDLAETFWWIVITNDHANSPDGTILLGFTADHGDVCAQCFDDPTEGDLDAAFAWMERREG